MITWLTGDVFDQLATLEDGSVDLVVTSPPFLALRSYLPADHPDKGKEIGSESTPAEFIDTLLRVTQELRRVLAPHGSIALELGDTYAASGGAGGDYGPEGLRAGQPMFRQQQPKQAWRFREDGSIRSDSATRLQEPKNTSHVTPHPGGMGWPLAKSTTMIPELYRVALAYGINPLTGAESPAGRWRVRNKVTWCRPNPPVGALGDKWRPATSDVVVACTSPRRFWDDLATRKAHKYGDYAPRMGANRDNDTRLDGGDHGKIGELMHPNPSGAPLLDYWEIPPTGYAGAHYAVYPPALVEPLVKAMCPQKVCRTCGEPSRRIAEPTPEHAARLGSDIFADTHRGQDLRRATGRARTDGKGNARVISEYVTTGWTDCGHDNWRPGLVLDPFAGSGTTLAVASGHGHDAIGIDLDERNEDLARERVGPLLWEET